MPFLIFCTRSKIKIFSFYKITLRAILIKRADRLNNFRRRNYDRKFGETIFMRRFLILKIVLIFTCGALAACTAAEKSANDKAASAGGTEQSKSTAENKPAETKKPAGKEVLYDFRKLDDDKPQTFSKAETAAVVKYLFGETTSKIEIRNRLSGSFTKPNAKETLYYFTGCEDETSKQFTTDCPHVSWDSVGWIAIYDGTAPILKTSEALGSSIEKITDVNGDGINEIVSVGGYAQSGIQTMGVSIGQISGGKYQNIKGFNGYAYNCAVGGGKSPSELFARVAVISYVPTTGGKIPEFSEEFFQAKCKSDDADSGSAFSLIDQSSWKKITKKEFDEFFDSLS